MVAKLPISLRLKRFWIRWTQWEFWPTTIVYLPVLVCYPIWALLSRDIFFFSLVNPKMRMGGLYGASKFQGLLPLDAAIKPKTLLFSADANRAMVESSLNAAQISFPIIIKPDLGERGKGVEKVVNARQLSRTLPTQTSDFVIQEYLDLPFEAGVFYIKKPGQTKGAITSIVVKGFLTVKGDGVHTIKELCLMNKRALLIWEKLEMSLSMDINRILDEGERIDIEPIGNHSRGTAFNDGNHLINPVLEERIEAMAHSLPEFHYGRFDLRAESEAQFSLGETIKVMEVNGANAEPAHIYQEGASLWGGFWTLLVYWHTIFLIARSNRNRFKPSSFAEAHLAYKQWQYIKNEKWNLAEREVDSALT